MRNNLIRKIELILRHIIKPEEKESEKNILKFICIGKGADIGCGSNKVSKNCIGVDLVGKGEIGKSGCEKNKISEADFCSNGDDLFMFKNNELDFIVARHNLEHYNNPKKTIEEWKRVLRVGGKVGVIVPDDDYVSSITLDAHLFSNKETSTHKVSFNSKSLRKLFIGSGFKILSSGVATKHWSIYLIGEK